MSMADLLCHRSFFSGKDNTMNVRIKNNKNTGGCSEDLAARSDFYLNTIKTMKRQL